MQRTRTLLSLALGISLASSAANTGLTGAFTDIDVDSDGFISQLEYRAHAKSSR